LCRLLEERPQNGPFSNMDDMAQAVKTTDLPQIPDYEITDKIGEGGIAEIFRARQISLNRDVAIKVLFADLTGDDDIVRRFDRESYTIARLNHPNIVHIIDRGKDNNRYYFIMEFVDGASFKDVIRSDQYTLQNKLKIIIGVLKGLDYAHKNGVIHRDIKPANILIDREGNPLVADFGIAQIVNKTEQEMTSTDVIMGTLAYMSPEQKLSSANVTLTTDIYSVGVMIYEILTGNKPQGRFKLPSEINSRLNRAFDEIIIRSLAQNPNERYQSAVELKDALLNAMSLPGPCEPPVPNHRASDTFIGKCQYLDTLKDTKYSSTMLVENKETHQLYIIKKKERSTDGLREARMLSSLKHKNIIDILGAGGDIRKTVIMMEYAPGGSLADRMVRKYEYDQAMHIITELAEGLAFAHKNGIIHGDIRPSNVLFAKNDQVKLADFGLPPHYNLKDKNWYAPPEKKVSRQGDIYALGVILYQLLTTGNPAYDRSGKLYTTPLNGKVPEDFKRIISKMLAIRVSRRYAEVEEFLKDWANLQEFLNRQNRPRVSEESRHQPGGVNKKQVLIFSGISLAVIVITALLIYFLK